MCVCRLFGTTPVETIFVLLVSSGTRSTRTSNLWSQGHKSSVWSLVPVSTEKTDTPSAVKNPSNVAPFPHQNMLLLTTVWSSHPAPPLFTKWWPQQLLTSVRHHYCSSPWKSPKLQKTLSDVYHTRGNNDYGPADKGERSGTILLPWSSNLPSPNPSAFETPLKTFGSPKYWNN